MQNASQYISPLTGGDNVRLIRTISASEIRSLWLKHLAIDLTPEMFSASEVHLLECVETGFRFFTPPEAAGSSQLYARLMQFPWYYEPDRWEYELCEKLPRHEDKILEVGCGDGAFLRRLEKQGFTNIRGLEINQDSITAAKATGLRVSSDSLSDLATSESCQFDWIFAFQVLEHVPDPGQFLTELIQLTRPEGRIVFSVPNNESFIALDPLAPLNMPPHHMGLWTPKVASRLTSYFPVRQVDVDRAPLEAQHARWYCYNRLRATGFPKPLPFLLALVGSFPLRINSQLRNSIHGHSMLVTLTVK